MEVRSFARQPVQIRRLQPRMPVTGKVAPTPVIGVDEDDIRFLGRRIGGVKSRQRCQWQSGEQGYRVFQVHRLVFIARRRRNQKPTSDSVAVLPAHRARPKQDGLILDILYERHLPSFISLCAPNSRCTLNWHDFGDWDYYWDLLYSRPVSREDKQAFCSICRTFCLKPLFRACQCL